MSPPTPAVVAAFGGDSTAVVRLAGGEGRSWRAGPVVLKPAAQEQLVRWVGEFVGALQLDQRLRVAGPVFAADGRWIVDGWAATAWVEGEHVSGAWDRILDVSADFHAAAAATGIGPSATLTSRDDPWAVGDRVAWAEQEAAHEWPDAVRRLLERLAPLVSSSATEMGRQVVHGDLCTNVL
ncbi:MAG TPA: hypothetical protein VLL25_13590, partial [Acidimicrobiales bacterium]|nr:hypothetical protein [Acidimicrobiales bacterium]